MAILFFFLILSGYRVFSEAEWFRPNDKSIAIALCLLGLVSVQFFDPAIKKVKASRKLRQDGK